jgi:hypothetical protein
MTFRKLLVLVLILSGISFLAVSCKHEMPVSCASLGFKITATSTAAMLNHTNGAIVVSAVGGTGFQYSLNGANFIDSGYFAGLAPFVKYKVIGRNSAGCTDTLDVTVGSYNPCQGVAINVTTTKVEASPNLSNGSITAAATGGTGFTYSLNSGAFQAAAVFSNLAAGTYTIAAKSSLGCLGISQVIIGTNNPCAGITVAISTTLVQPTLNLANGSITAVASGGAGFTYSLNNGAFQASGIFSAKPAGTYTVTAKNSNGCTGTVQATLIGADPCAGVTVVVGSTQVNPTTGLSNGSITASATGGSAFTYSINNGAYQASATFTGLATGNYTLTAKNSNGCTGVKQVTLGANNPCTGVTVAVTSTQVNPMVGQANGSITASATGGAGFTYSINNGAYQASGTFSGLAAGTYTISAKNSNGCLGVKQITLTATDPCAGVTVVVATTNTNPSTGLSNGSITAVASGSTGFNYSINNGAYQASGTFSGLAAGTYSVTAKSTNGCLGTKQVVLTATSPCANVNIALSATVANTTPCVAPTNNGKITLTASGSTGLTYNINGGAYQASNIFASLNAGTYLMGVKDVNGCTKTLSLAVAVMPAGVTFAPVKALILSRCAGGSCHTNGGSAAGYNFDTDCNIVNYWSQINKSTVLYTMIKMPLGTLLSASEKTTVTNWINAGHTYDK